MGNCSSGEEVDAHDGRVSPSHRKIKNVANTTAIENPLAKPSLQHDNIYDYLTSSEEDDVRMLTFLSENVMSASLREGDIYSMQYQLRETQEKQAATTAMLTQILQRLLQRNKIERFQRCAEVLASESKGSCASGQHFRSSNLMPKDETTHSDNASFTSHSSSSSGVGRALGVVSGPLAGDSRCDVVYIQSEGQNSMPTYTVQHEQPSAASTFKDSKENSSSSSSNRAVQQMMLNFLSSQNQSSYSTSNRSADYGTGSKSQVRAYPMVDQVTSEDIIDCVSIAALVQTFRSQAVSVPLPSSSLLSSRHLARIHDWMDNVGYSSNSCTNPEDTHAAPIKPLNVETLAEHEANMKGLSKLRQNNLSNAASRASLRTAALYNKIESKEAFSGCGTGSEADQQTPSLGDSLINMKKIHDLMVVKVNPDIIGTVGTVESPNGGEKMLNFTPQRHDLSPPESPLISTQNTFTSYSFEPVQSGSQTEAETPCYRSPPLNAVLPVPTGADGDRSDGNLGDLLGLMNKKKRATGNKRTKSPSPMISPLRRSPRSPRC